MITYNNNWATVIIIIILVIVNVCNSSGGDSSNSNEIESEEFPNIKFKIAGISNNKYNNEYIDSLNEIGISLEIPKENIKFYQNIDNQSLFDELTQQNYNLIIFFNNNNNQFAQKISKTLNNSTIIIFKNNKNNLLNDNNKNLIEINYPFTFSSFLDGYVSGLLTKNDILGYLISEEEKEKEESFLNMFYFGAKLSNPTIKLIFYTIENDNLNNKDIYESSINSLLYLNADYIYASNSINQDIVSNILNSYSNYHEDNDGITIIDTKLLFNTSFNFTSNILPIVSNLLLNKSINSALSSKLDINLNINPILPILLIDKLNLDLASILSELISEVQDVEQGSNCNEIFKHKNNCVQDLQWIKIKDDEDFIYLGNFTGVIIIEGESKVVELGITIVSSILIAGLIVILICVFKYRNKPSFKSASPTFLIFIVIGGIVVFIGCIIWVSGINDFSCNAKFWMISFGFTMMIGSIVVKNIRIWLIFDNPKLLSVKITNLKLFSWVSSMFLINLFLLSIISGLGNLRAVLIPTYTIDNYSPDGSQLYELMCEMDDSGIISLYFLLVYFAIIILIGIFVSWKTRIVDIEEFNESRSVSYSLYLIIVSLLILVPLIISTGKNTEIICSGGLFVTAGIIAIMFIPKFYGLKIYGAEGSNEIFRQTRSSIKKKKNSTTTTGGGSDCESPSKKSSKQLPKRVNIYLYDFTDDEDDDQVNKQNKSATANDGDCNSNDIDIITITPIDDHTLTLEPNSEAGNEITYNEDPTYTEASEQPNATPRTTTDLNTPRSEILTPRTTNSNTNTEEAMSPRQYHIMMTTIEEEKVEEKEIKDSISSSED